MTNAFAELGLSAAIVASVQKAQWHKPTEIQKKAIPLVREDRDLLVIAQTGSGKTGAFLLPIIDCIAQTSARRQNPTALILAPTRELALQLMQNVEFFVPAVGIDDHAYVLGRVVCGDAEIVSHCIFLLLSLKCVFGDESLNGVDLLFVKGRDCFSQLVGVELIAQTGDAVVTFHLDDDELAAVGVIAFEVLQSLLCFLGKRGIVPFELGKGIDFVEIVFHTVLLCGHAAA